jgi:hypothetical protein
MAFGLSLRAIGLTGYFGWSGWLDCMADSFLERPMAGWEKAYGLRASGDREAVTSGSGRFLPVAMRTIGVRNSQLRQPAK